MGPLGTQGTLPESHFINNEFCKCHCGLCLSEEGAHRIRVSDRPGRCPHCGNELYELMNEDQLTKELLDLLWDDGGDEDYYWSVLTVACRNFPDFPDFQLLYRSARELGLGTDISPDKVADYA